MVRRTSRVSFRDFFTPADHAFVDWTVRNKESLLAAPRIRRSMGEAASEDALDEGPIPGLRRLILSEVLPAANASLSVRPRFGEDGIESPAWTPHIVQSARDLVANTQTGHDASANWTPMTERAIRSAALEPLYEGRASVVDGYGRGPLLGGGFGDAGEGVEMAARAAKPKPREEPLWPDDRSPPVDPRTFCRELKRDLGRLRGTEHEISEELYRVRLQMTMIEGQLQKVRRKREQVAAQAASLAGRAHDRSPVGAELVRLRAEMERLDAQLRELEAAHAELVERRTELEARQGRYRDSIKDALIQARERCGYDPPSNFDRFPDLG